MRTLVQVRHIVTALAVSTVAIALGLPACASKKTTELVIAVQTDVQVPKDLDSVKVKVLSFGSVQFEQDYDVGPGGLKLPATIGIVPGKDDTQPVDIVIVGSFKGKERVLRQARLKFASDRVVLMRMPLRFSCFEKTDCGSDQTCVAGVCQGVEVEVSKLPDFSNDAVFGPGGATNGNGCFDPLVCLTSTTPLVGRSDDPCTFDLGGGASTGPVDDGGSAVDAAAPPKSFDSTKPLTLLLRVDVTKQTGFCSGGECKVPLDYDPDEGWFYVDGTHAQARLAPNLCQRLKGGAFLGIGVTDACGTKNIETPFCDQPATTGCDLGDIAATCNLVEQSYLASGDKTCGYLPGDVRGVCASSFTGSPQCACLWKTAALCATHTRWDCSDGSIGLADCKSELAAYESKCSKSSGGDSGTGTDASFGDSGDLFDSGHSSSDAASGPADSAVDGATTGDAPGGTCRPITCAAAKASCGPVADGCGGMLDCGSCMAPQSCGWGFGPSTCGVPTDGGACHRQNCASVGANCGPIGDGCGGLIDSCGTCPGTQVCGRGGRSRCG